VKEEGKASWLVRPHNSAAEADVNVHGGDKYGQKKKDSKFERRRKKIQRRATQFK
jgi:hypothetical protein